MISTDRWSSGDLLATAASTWPGIRFFKTLLLSWVCLRVPRTRQELAPAVSLQQAVDGALMHLMTNALLIGALDFSGGRDLPLHGSREEGREQLPLLLPGEQQDTWRPPFPTVSTPSIPSRL